MLKMLLQVCDPPNKYAVLYFVTDQIYSSSCIPGRKKHSLLLEKHSCHTIFAKAEYPMIDE